MSPAHRGSVGIAATALLASSATLVCCVLPAVLVSLGAGAVLLNLVATFPQLIWLSEHKQLVFGVAGVILAISGAALWYARRVPCPADPGAARMCVRLRALSYWLYGAAVGAFFAGFMFAYVFASTSST